jgi:hypothetical protein
LQALDVGGHGGQVIAEAGEVGLDRAQDVVARADGPVQLFELGFISLVYSEAMSTGK